MLIRAHGKNGGMPELGVMVEKKVLNSGGTVAKRDVVADVAPEDSREEKRTCRQRGAASPVFLGKSGAPSGNRIIRLNVHEAQQETGLERVEGGEKGLY